MATSVEPREGKIRAILLEFVHICVTQSVSAPIGAATLRSVSEHTERAHPRITRRTNHGRYPASQHPPSVNPLPRSHHSTPHIRQVQATRVPLHISSARCNHRCRNDRPSVCFDFLIIKHAPHHACHPGLRPLVALTGRLIESSLGGRAKRGTSAQLYSTVCAQLEVRRSMAPSPTAMGTRWQRVPYATGFALRCHLLPSSNLMLHLRLASARLRARRVAVR